MFTPDNKETYNSLMTIENLSGISEEESLKLIAKITDLSYDLKKIEGLERSIKLIKELQERKIEDVTRSISHYYIANAWSYIKNLKKSGTPQSWDWEQDELEKEVFNLRTSLKMGSLPKELTCCALTNLGNAMNEIGRFVEAIEYWDTVLSVLPRFSMAIGNRGYGIYHYAFSLYDSDQVEMFLKHSHAGLTKALTSIDLHESARIGFTKTKKLIEDVILPDKIDINHDASSFGETDEEIRYRKWCLKNKLFLNPLNDLGSYSIAAMDSLKLPSIVVEMDEGPYYHGYFNQMKQEFVSARYLFYEGIQATDRPHFSDKKVSLVNTLDYPSYSLSVEKVKASFKTAYSIFDKIAFFLNYYMVLNIPERRVSFKTFWYTTKRKEKRLRNELLKLKNWPMRGLFWLSKDLYEDRQGFKDSIHPDAQELNIIRNHLEHKYLKLHESIWLGNSERKNEAFRSIVDSLAFSMYRKSFEEKALRLLKMVRAAMIYLSLTIHWEEKKRWKNRGNGALVAEMQLGDWEDNWKI
jgi:hypothetical protein